MATIDAIQIAPDETPFCGTHHTKEDIIGYVVVRTMEGVGKVEDLRVFMVDDDPGEGVQRYCFAYGDALVAVREARARSRRRRREGEWARLDVLYRDGCRGIL